MTQALSRQRRGPGVRSKEIDMTAQEPEQQASDADMLELLKSSGILNPDVTLDKVMSLSERLDLDAVAARGFIFRDFLYRPC